ncbi:MAG: hypothetical protein Q4P13_10505 [Psychrobacter sp.]|nr:hypothetical protein [Psychrobacter sp.]
MSLFIKPVIKSVSQSANQSKTVTLALTAALSIAVVSTGCNKNANTTDANLPAATESDDNKSSSVAQTSEVTTADEGGALETTATSSSNDAPMDATTPLTTTTTTTSSATTTTAPASTTDSIPADTTTDAASPAKSTLISNPVKSGTPEAALKAALDTLYYGDAKDAAKYYQVDMPNFSDELAKTQFAFQKTVEGVTITNTQYNQDKTQAVIEGELRLKGQKDPAPLTYQMKKIDGQWKILG